MSNSSALETLILNNRINHIEVTENEEFKLLKDNIISINVFIEKTWQNDESVRTLCILNDKVNLEKIVRLTKGMRTYTNGDGYNRASNEEISSEFFMNELLNVYKVYITKHNEKPTVLTLLENMLKEYNAEDKEFLLEYTYDLATYHLPIYTIIQSYKTFTNTLDKENQDFILSTSQISLHAIHSRSSKFLRDIDLLNRHYELSKTDSEVFKLDICRISDKVNKPNEYVYNERNNTDTYIPNYSFQLVENLIYNEKDFYIKSVKNNDGVIEFITNKDETISFLEYKELALVELAKYHEYIGKIIEVKINDIKNIGSNKIENTNDFITLLRNYRKGE